MNISSLLLCAKLAGPHSFFKRVILQNIFFYYCHSEKECNFPFSRGGFRSVQNQTSQKLASYLRSVILSRLTLKYTLKCVSTFHFY